MRKYQRTQQTRSSDDSADQQESLELQGFLEKIVQLGKDFDQETFRTEAEKFLQRIEPEVKANEREIPSYRTCYDIASNLLPRLQVLNPQDLNLLGSEIVSLEQAPAKIRDFTTGIGVKAIGRALYLDPQLGPAYFNLAVLTEGSRAEGLNRSQVKELYLKALSCPDPQNKTRETLYLEHPWVFKDK